MTPVKILHLEDNLRDAAFVRDLLERDWPEAEITLVTSREEYTRALDDKPWDIVLSDFRLPSFGGQAALAHGRQVRPEVPFIFVSGTIGEEAAVESVRAGAADYVLKDRLERLPFAIRRALAESEERRQRRLAERQIREQAELLDKVQDGIVVTDLSHRILYWNRGAERILGWTAEETVGRNILDFFGAALAATYSSMEQLLASGDEWRGELALGNKPGREMLAEVRVTTIRDDDGVPKSRLKIITDVTERRRLEEQVLRTQRLESLGMLAAGIAHDLNNALAPMLMAGGLLRTRVTDPADVRLVELLEQSAERGAGLVKQIVSFAGGHGRDRVLLQTKHVLRDVFQLLEDTFPKSIRLECNIPNGLWPVNADPTQIHQVLLNLSINARDAMPNGGVLRLVGHNHVVTEESARDCPGATPGRFVGLEVDDTGTGIPADIIEQIWQPFFTTKAEDKGTGLGLSTVRGIVASHGGFLTVKSQPGSGSTFCVFLPAVADGDETGPGVGAAPRPARHGRGEVVFVVDDQGNIREAIAVALSQHGFRPLTMADGIEALAKFADRIHDASLVITDLDMPGLSGVALAQAIMHLNPSIKILFISGTRESIAGKHISSTPNSAFLGKPFLPDELLAKVAELLGTSDPAA